MTVWQEGARTIKRLLDYYNLDMIIAVGYRVKFGIATKFRQWGPGTCVNISLRDSLPAGPARSGLRQWRLGLFPEVKDTFVRLFLLDPADGMAAGELLPDVADGRDYLESVAEEDERYGSD